MAADRSPVALALVAMSHSPLLGHVDLVPEVTAELEAWFARAREAARAFDPDLVVVFFPDHYNGVFYDLMPPFALASAATSIGDYGSQAGPLDVPADVAEHVARAVLAAGIDLAVSHDLRVDHGAAQPLEILFGDIAARPVLPVFVNGVAPPLGPPARVRLLGEAIGSALVTSGRRRVLLLASGGLSHDPPVPRIGTATPEQRAALLGGGRHLDAAGRAARQQRVIDAARAFATGDADIAPLAPEWDREFLRVLAAGDLRVLDDRDVDEMTRAAGHSVHEVRTWIAAYAALSTAGPYQVQATYYRPIPELIAGFALTIARPH